MRMAASRASSLAALLVVVVVAALLGGPPAADAAQTDCAQRYPPLAKGLSFDHYKKSCPKAESIVKDFLTSAVKQNPGLLPALIRIHFHDCFVQGCDGSVLLDNSTTTGETSEKTYAPNQTLRPAAFKAINDIRDRLEKACGRVVSCADIVALTARDSVQLAGGPCYKVPLGRRDGLSPASQNDVFDGLPPPSSNVAGLMEVLSKIKLDTTDLVALSGGHTVGIAHCTSFQNRLFPARDPTMDQWFFSKLKQTCPVPNTDNTTVNDIRTPAKFDNKYYVDLMNRQGLFTSDQDLYSNATTKPVVIKFAVDQGAFFDQFVYSYVKMGMIGVLTDQKQGQIRANCAARNPGATGMPWSVVETVVDAAESLVL